MKKTKTRKTKQEIEKLVKAFRKEEKKGVKAKDFAQKNGISVQSLYKWKSDKTPVKRRTTVKILKDRPAKLKAKNTKITAATTLAILKNENEILKNVLVEQALMLNILREARDA